MKDKVNEGENRDSWEEIVLLWKNWHVKKSSFTKTFLSLLLATLFLQILLILDVMFAFP